MDERLSSSNLASKLLHERGRRSIYREERCMDNFWFLNPHSAKRKLDFGDERDSCLGTLRRSRDLRWGVRKKVVYVPRQRDSPLHLPSAEEVTKKEGSKKRLREDVKQGMSEREVDESLNPRVQLEKQFNGVKRKRENTCTNGMKPKKKERRCRTENGGSCKWSDARYEYAKKSLVEVMEKMGATWGKPVVLYDLRVEVRKRIGDAGLLDHLLDHLPVGMVVADGEKRFVGRHNSEGALEYWLEPADLVQIRREAGITDPYWVPPPGWKVGNADTVCTSHGHCEKIASQLNEEVNLLRSEMEDLKLMFEQSQVQLQLQAVDRAWKEKHDSLLIQHQKLQEQLIAISSSFLAMKEENSSLKAENQKRMPDELAMVVEEPNQANLASKMQFLQEKEKGKEVLAESKMVRNNGFRIYKPQNTFLQPNMVTSGRSSPHSTSYATSAPPQLMLLPHPQPCSATFNPSQNSQSLGQTQAHLEVVLARPQPPSPAPQPSARYPCPGMKNSGASQMECDEFMVAMAHPTETNSAESFDSATGLVLATLTY